jgi:catechol 2,3-dioxygenase-like lactoylglutathione lyase family enzyme
MTALCGFHHVAVLTTDLDRLLDFYRKVFDAAPVLEETEKDRRHAMIDVGGGGLLHALEVPQGQIHLAGGPRYERGRLDHLALNTTTREAFLELQRRAMEAGATDGHVRDSGALRSFRFHDPDGMEGEVIWANPDLPLASTPLYGNRAGGA